MSSNRQEATARLLSKHSAVKDLVADQPPHQVREARAPLEEVKAVA